MSDKTAIVMIFVAMSAFFIAFAVSTAIEAYKKKRGSTAPIILSFLAVATTIFTVFLFTLPEKTGPVENSKGNLEGTEYVEINTTDMTQYRKEAAALFHEIRVAYKNNELSADDQYKGNRYVIIGAFDGVSEDGLLNVLNDEIKVTVKIIDGQTNCYVFCDFDSEVWRDELAKLNRGDEIIIEGECNSWGTWSDCRLGKIA